MKKTQKKQLSSLKYLLLSLILMQGSISYAEMVLIVSASSPQNSIERKRVSRIFMGKVNSFADGEKATPIELTSGASKDAFQQQVLKKSSSQLSAYWARVQFSGAANQPKEFTSEDEIKGLVASNSDFISYIDDSKLDASVKKLEIK